MNHIYRLVWSEIANTWVAVAEIAKGRGKRSSTKKKTPTSGCLPQLRLLAHALAFAIIGAPAHALDVGALPTGGSVTAGSATISHAANVLTVQQVSQRAAIDWKSFNIGASATVNFNQPNANAVALNRIGGNSASEIYGKLNANGQVFFSNPNGMLFARGAQVNVGGILATTMSLGNSDFMAGNYRLTNPGSGSIRNEGIINALGGVALIGNTTHNAGQIIATTVTLAAGNTVAIDLTADGFIRARVEDAALKSSIENSGSIDGAQITLTAGQAREALDRVVNNSGIIRAIGLTMKGGEILLEGAVVENTGSIVASGANGGGTIKLLGDMVGGTVKVGGILDASASLPSPLAGEGLWERGSPANGGFIETSAAHVQVADTARVTTATLNGKSGTWLIDPVDFTIAASGGDMTGAAVATALAGGNFTIQSTTGGSGTAGDVNVNDSVSWSVNKLTLNAQNNININANLNGSGSASLALEYGQASAWGGGNNTYNVNAAVNLPAGNNFSTKLGSSGTVKNYTVITSLGAAGSVTATDLQGMNGNLATNYALGSNIDAFTSGWNGGAGFLPVGTFTGTFDGLGHTLTGLTINRPATDNVGLFGYTNGTIRNVGLVGGSIIGRNQVGGLAGLNGTGTISHSYSTGTVTGTGTTGYVGGLVGYNTATVINSYSTGTVSSASGNYVGGLVGGNASGSAAIYYSYSTGTVSGANNVGGLLGNNGGAIYSSYSIGTVSGSASNVGGLVGGNTGTITNSYSTGGVTGASSVGGLVGFNSGGTVSNNFWDTITSGWATSAIGTGLTTSAMMTQASYPQAGGQWGFTNTWYMVEGSTRPILRMEYSTTITNAHQLQLIGMNLAANYTLANNLDLAAALANPNDIWGTASVAGVGGATLTVATGITSGFAPIGDVTTQFTGTFNGLNHTISNLAINRPAAGYVGLFGNIATGGTVSNLGLLASNVIGSDFVGALAGTNNGNISNSYVSGGTVNGGNSTVGGLVGYNYGSISNSYVSGVTVGSNWYVGGLAGENSGTITNTYSSGGTVNGVSYFGGLVGANWNIVDTSYSTNAVAAGGSNGGGLIGWEEGFASNNSYWDIQTSGRATSSGPETGLSAAQMTAMSNFTAAGWDIANTGGSGAVWRIYEGHTAPLLTSFMTPLTLTGAPDVTVTYNGAAQSGASTMPDIGNFFGVAATGTNAGFYNGYYSNQQGYDFTGGNLTITPAPLTVTAIALSKTVGNADPLLTYMTAGLQSTDTTTSTLSGALARLDGETAGLYPINQGTLVSQSTNYTLNFVPADFGIVAAPPPTNNTWLGLLDSYWTTVGNWSLGHVPIATETVLIPDVAGTAFVQMADGTYTVKNITSAELFKLTGSGTSFTLTQSGAFNAGLDLGAGTSLISQGTLSLSSYTLGSGAKISITQSGTGILTIGGLLYTVINSLGAAGSATALDLQGMSGGLAGRYALGSNIDASVTSSWNSFAGFAPVGNSTTKFTGAFDGLGHTITGLTINRPTTSYIGLFGYADPGSILKNVGLINGNITGEWYIGGLAGYNDYGTITNSYNTGAVNGASYVGGLAGFNWGGTIASSYNTGTVIGTAQYTGGLVGVNWNTITDSYNTGTVNGASYTGGLVGVNYVTITNSYSTGAVSGSGSHAGGLAGWNSGGTISNSYSTGAVSGSGYYVGGLAGYSSGTISNSYNTGAVSGRNNWVGGLTGYNDFGTIANSYNTGAVSGTDYGYYVGGLAGRNDFGTIADSYNTGTVSGSYNNVGGLAGINWVGSTIANSYNTGVVSGRGNNVGGLAGYSGGTISNSYNTGAVSGRGNNVGGLAGYSDGTFTNSYWDTQTSGKSKCIGSGSGVGCTGLTTAQMKQQASFTGWDFSTVWNIDQGTSFPYLRANEQNPHPTAPVTTTTALSLTTASAIQAIATVIQQTVLRSAPSAFVAMTKSPNADNQIAALNPTTAGDASAGIRLLTIIVANTTLQKPADEVVQLAQPKGSMLTCPRTSL